MTTLKVFIGYDSREQIAYDVAKHSILKRTKNKNISVHPLKQHVMRELGIYNRSVDKLASTEFTFTRFFVPYLMDYKGYAVFIDCDFLILCDIEEMFQIAIDQFNKNSDLAVCVCKHNYVPKTTVKMDNQVQHVYPRKNWSSAIVFKCDHTSLKILNLSNLNNEEFLTGKVLHRFYWLSDIGDKKFDEVDERDLMNSSEKRIGSLPLDFNWLSGEYEIPEHIPEGRSTPRIVHYTLGGPWFADEVCWNYPFADLWIREAEEVIGRKWTMDLALPVKK